MKIPTTIEYDKVANCGDCDCEFPICEAPRKTCQSIYASASFEWVIAKYNSELGRYDYYLIQNYDWADGGYIHTSESQAYSVFLDGTGSDAEISVSEYTVDTADPKTGTLTITESGLIDVPAAQQAAYDALVAHEINWDSEDLTFGSSCTSRFDFRDPYLTLDLLFDGTVVRYQMGIPEDYERSYYHIEWDEVFIPDEWYEWYQEYVDWRYDYQAYLAALEDYQTCMAIHHDEDICGVPPEEPEPFTLVEPEDKIRLITHRSFEYTGGAETSPWYVIPLQDIDGIVGEQRVINIRVKCYRWASHGVVPTPFDEQIDLTNYV